MNINKLRQIFLVTQEFEKAVVFYQDTLGLQLQFRDEDKWAQFSAGDVSFALASVEEGLREPVLTTMCLYLKRRLG